MEIKLLPTEINERFRSNININNLTQCILELIFNSLDAKATTIAVRINIAKHEVQIVDNGVGISLDDLQNVGIRYMTSRFVSLHSFENKHKYYGYKGESIASIICISKTFNITTRYYRDTDTYCKTFENGSFVNTVPVSERSSKGTTAVVNGFLFNYPVKQRRIKSSLELNNIKFILKSLAVIHPKVSFSLRDNTTGRILLDCYRTETVSKSLCALYKGIVPECLLTVKVSKDNITVSGLIYTKTYQNCKPQLVYVNRRPVNNEIIEKHVKENLLKAFDNATSEWNSVFVININCPYTEVDFSFDSSNILVEFKSWNIVLQCISKMISRFTNKYKTASSQKQEFKLQNTEDTIVNTSSEQKVDNKTQPKNEPSNILRMENEKTKRIAALNALNNLKKYRKSLGLKKSKLELKKKKRNIFEKTNEFSQLSLTLKEIPTNKSLKTEKLKLNPVCLKTIFDDQFDSQNLVYNDKLHAPTQFVSQGIHPENDEAQGKEFVMDLFLKSLTPSLGENNMLQIKTAKLEDIQEKHPDDKVMVPKAPVIGEVLIGKTCKSNSISVSSATKSNHKPPESIHISFDNELIKKRRIDKLNKIGTSLVKDKLLKIENVNSEAVQTSFYTEMSSGELRNIPPIDKDQKSTFGRVKSKDKSVQTNFLAEDKFNRVSVGVQSSPDRQADHNDRGLTQKGQIHTEFDQNAMRSLSTEAYNTPKPSQNIDGNYKNNSSVQKGNIISKDATFSSHWYPKNVIVESPKTQNTTVEFNTRNILNDLNSVQDLEKNNLNLFFENSFTLNFSNANNEEDANISRFFNSRNENKRRHFKLSFDQEKHKNNFSMSINTSKLFQEHVRNGNIKILLMKKSNNL